jgi:hypothetical protein
MIIPNGMFQFEGPAAVEPGGKNRIPKNTLNQLNIRVHIKNF